MSKLLKRLVTAVRLRCPRCQRGHLFIGPMTMNQSCSHCGLAFEPEPGFYLGSIYANYAATVLLVTSSFVTLVYGYGFDKNLVLWGCVALAVLFPLWFFRYARSIWLSLIYSVSSSDFGGPMTNESEGSLQRRSSADEPAQSGVGSVFAANTFSMK